MSNIQIAYMQAYQHNQNRHLAHDIRYLIKSIFALRDKVYSVGVTLYGL